MSSSARWVLGGSFGQCVSLFLLNAQLYYFDGILLGCIRCYTLRHPALLGGSKIFGSAGLVL